ncbi:unnamed protein product [Penicillium salamii]|nr:unnamed protein product [Penicillium salamii]CAG8321526.1 unnamed protein product [Penicillium salamii]CAG8407322.1 unnamed protein product [Penicillium salamii]
MQYERCFVKSFGWYECPGKLFIAMEYLENGDLFAYLYQRPPLPETETKEVTYQILEGLGMMHENGFAHRDLKPNNILIKSHPPKNWWIKLADFGITKRIEESHGQLSTLKGTPRYFAPELWGFVERGTEHATDIWALGETAFEMLSKNPAFATPGLLAGYKSQRQFPAHILVEAGVSQPGIDFVASLMRPCPNDRQTTETAKSNAWVQSVIPSAYKPTTDVPNKVQLTPEDAELAKRSASRIIKSSRDKPEASLGNNVPGTTTESPWLSVVQEETSLSQQTGLEASTPASCIIEDKVKPKHTKPNHWYQTSPDLQHHMDSVRSVAFSSDARQLICRSKTTIMAWDLASGNLQEEPQSCSELYLSMISSSTAFPYSPNNLLWACGDRTSHSDSGDVLVFDTATEILQKEFSHYGWITSLAFSYDNAFLASAAIDDSIRIWNMATLECERILEGHRDQVTSVAFSPDSRLLASASKDRMVRVYDLGTGALQQTFEGHLGYVNVVVFSPNSQLLASCSSDCTVKLWDLMKRSLHQTLRGHGYELTSIAFSPNGGLMASASINRTMRVWYSAEPCNQ